MLPDGDHGRLADGITVIPDYHIAEGVRKTGPDIGMVPFFDDGVCREFLGDKQHRAYLIKFGIVVTVAL